MPQTPDFDITPQSRDEEIIKSIVDGTPYDEPAESRIEYRLIELKEAIETGGVSYAAAISVSLDTSTYVLTIQLLNKDGQAIGQAQTIDLPLESTVVSGSYDNQSKSLILTLVSGDTVTIPIGDLITGLVSDTDYATTSKAGIVKPDGTTITVDADGTLHAAAISINSWYDVRTVVRQGLANSVFQVGDQLTCTRGSDEIIWDIVNITNDSITLLMHETLPDMVYDAKEAIFAFPDGLAAGEYHFTVTNQPWYTADVGKTISFTLTQAIPEGGQLVLGNAYNATLIGANITSYASGASTTAIESAVMAEGDGGTDLGSLTSAGTPASNINSIQKALLGSNTWKESAQRQWLNSDKAAGSVWTPQTPYDRPPTWASSSAGFMNGMEEEFLSVVAQTTYVTCRNTVSDGGGSDTCTDKFFLPSRKEIFGADEVSGVSEGTQYQYYVGSTDADRIKYRAGSARAWRLRTPYAPHATSVRSVGSSGALYYINSASTAIGLSAACIIK